MSLIADKLSNARSIIDELVKLADAEDVSEIVEALTDIEDYARDQIIELEDSTETDDEED